MKLRRRSDSVRPLRPDRLAGSQNLHRVAPPLARRGLLLRLRRPIAQEVQDEPGRYKSERHDRKADHFQYRRANLESPP
jgi:hypothetical protein